VTRDLVVSVYLSLNCAHRSAQMSSVIGETVQTLAMDLSLNVSTTSTSDSGGSPDDHRSASSCCFSDDGAHRQRAPLTASEQRALIKFSIAAILSPQFGRMPPTTPTMQVCRRCACAPMLFRHVLPRCQSRHCFCARLQCRAQRPANSNRRHRRQHSHPARTAHCSRPTIHCGRLGCIVLATRTDLVLVR
jgi:hypothetical protein